MIRFLKSVRAGIVVGQANKLFENGRYREALQQVERAQRLELEENYAWLCHSIAGKSLRHLGEPESALQSLLKARELLAPKLKKQGQSAPLQNIIDEITRHIEEIEAGRAK